MPLIDMLGQPAKITVHVREGEIIVTPGPEEAPLGVSRRRGAPAYQPQIAHNRRGRSLIYNR